MRDSAVFYRSFYEAISTLEIVDQGRVYNAIFEYCFNFNEVELTGVSKTVFTLIKPQLLANIRKWENGQKPKVKQEISKPKANRKQNRRQCK